MRLSVVISVTNTVVITIASGRQRFYPLLKSGSRGPDVPGRVALSVNRWCQDDRQGKTVGKSDSGHLLRLGRGVAEMKNHLAKTDAQ